MKVSLTLSALLLAAPCAAQELSTGSVYNSQPGLSSVAADVHWRAFESALSPDLDLVVDPGRSTTFASVGGSYRFDMGRWYLEPEAAVGVWAGNVEKRFIGSRGVAHISGTVGIRITPAAAVELVVSHWSNAFIAMPDEGLNSVGVRVAWRY